MLLKIKKSVLTYGMLFSFCLCMVCVYTPIQANETIKYHESDMIQINMTENRVYEEDSGVVILEEEPVPLAKSVKGWSLINAICCVSVIFLAVILMFVKETEYTMMSKKRMCAKGLSWIAALDAILILVLTQDMSLPMQMSDQWTSPMILILVAQIIILCIGIKADGHTRQTLSK